MDKRLIIRSTRSHNWDDRAIVFSDITLKSNLFRLLRDASFNLTKSVYIIKKEYETDNGSWRMGKNKWGGWSNLLVSEWMMLGDKLVLLGFFKKISKGKQSQFKITKSTSSMVSFLVKKFYILGNCDDDRFIENKYLNKYFNLVKNSKYIY